MTVARSTSTVRTVASVLAAALVMVLTWPTAAFGAPGSPFGNFESASGSGGGIAIKGWTVDPSTAASIYIWVTVDGVGRHVYADQYRGDIGRALPPYGPYHGFSAVVPASPGEHTVCVTASNVGEGAHQPLGCKTVTVQSGSPWGNFESASGGSGTLAVKGWTIDPDSAGPIYIWVTINGAGRHAMANVRRPDVGRAFPGYGEDHGFVATFGVPAGSHYVCVTASNVGAGSHTPLGCRTVSVASATPPNQNLRWTSELRAAWSDDLCAGDRMVTRRILGRDIRINARAVPAFDAFDRALTATGYSPRWMSAYSCRLIAGTDQYSLHSYGIATDLDPNENPFISPVDWTVRFSSGSTWEERAADVAAGRADTAFTPDQIAAVEGIRTVDGHQVWAWGGRWRTPLDSMHFQLNVTPDELARGLDPATTW